MAIPARVVELNEERARVKTESQTISVGRQFVPDLKVGDWVLVNTGQIVAQLSAEEAETARELLRELATLSFSETA